MSTRQSSTSSKTRQRKSSPRRRIRPFRLALVLVVGIGIIWTFFWVVIQFVVFLWGFLSQINLFSSHEPLQAPITEDVIVEESSTHSEELPSESISDDAFSFLMESFEGLPPLLTSTVFDILPSNATSNAQPYVYGELPSKKILSKREQASSGDLLQGVLLRSGLVIQLNGIEWIVAEGGNGLKLTYQLTNLSDSTQTFSQSIESSGQLHFLAGAQVLKEQLSFYDQTVTAIYPFQYLVQSFKNNYSLGYQFHDNERSCHDVLTLESAQATTCSLVYDFVSADQYEILIYFANESYRIPIQLEPTKSND